jgi:hypothetical protein
MAVEAGVKTVPGTMVQAPPPNVTEPPETVQAAAFAGIEGIVDIAKTR